MVLTTLLHLAAQYVDNIPKAVKGNVSEVLDSKDQRNAKAELLVQLDLAQVRVRPCSEGHPAIRYTVLNCSMLVQLDIAQVCILPCVSVT